MTRRDTLRLAALAGFGLTRASAQKPPIVGLKADTGPLRSECGVGALMPWADVLWASTYDAHTPRTGSGTGLWAIDDRLEARLVHSHDGTHANRLVHAESQQVFIGPYAIDLKGNFRFISRFRNERLTATMRHLTDPANRVYMLTMEGKFYEMDVKTLEVRELADLVKQFQIGKPPHFKAGHTSQDRVIVCNNTYSDWDETEGMLAEWDGKRWHIVLRKPFMEAAGRSNFGGVVFATGWDELSALFYVLAEGKWTRRRLPKSSHTFDHYWQTEWTRIREVETQRFLMDCHGMFYELQPVAFRGAVWGVRPVCSHLRVVPDFCSYRGMLVLGGNQNSPSSGDTNALAGQPQSGLWFGKTDDLWSFGKPQGWGGVWRDTALEPGDVSDPILMTGFDKKVLHLVQSGAAPATISIEVDFLGMGQWHAWQKIAVPSGAYTPFFFPAGFSAHWVRLRSESACRATAEFIYT